MKTRKARWCRMIVRVSSALSSWPKPLSNTFFFLWELLERQMECSENFILSYRERLSLVNLLRPFAMSVTAAGRSFFSFEAYLKNVPS